MSTPTSEPIWFCVTIDVKGELKELTLWAHHVTVDASGNLLFYHNSTQQAIVHFAFAQGLWRSFWQLDEDKLPLGLQAFNLSNSPVGTAIPSKESVPFNSNLPQTDIPSSPTTSVTASGHETSTSNSFSQAPIATPIPPVQILTDEQRVLSHLAQHAFLGLSSLSATLDIQEDTLEKLLLQLCKEKKIPLTYLNIPSAQEELNKILPKFMEMKPKSLKEVIEFVAQQETYNDIDSLQIHIWVLHYHQQKRQSDQHPAPENTDS